MKLPVLKSREDDRPVERTHDDAWSPMAEFERLRRQLASPFDVLQPFGDLAGAFAPLADVEELDDEFVVEIELPGVRSEDVDVELAGRELTVSGERKEKERVGILRRRERTTGQFRHSILLPGDVDDAGVRADLDDGVLTLHLPKPERDRPRRIEIG